MEPIHLFPAYRNEDVANVDRAPPSGLTADPRDPTRMLRTRTRYLRDPRDAAIHEIELVDRRLRKALTGDVFATTNMFPGVRGLDQRVAARAMFTFAPDHKLYAGDATAHAIGVREYVGVGRAPHAPESLAVYVPDVLEVWHHSSFVAGGDVLCAGELATDATGRLLLVSNFSGHYRPDLSHFVEFLSWLERRLPLDHVVAEVFAESRPHQVNAAELVRGGGWPSRFLGCY